MDAIELGNEIHFALSKIDWMGQESPIFGSLSNAARKLLLAFLERPDAKEIFAKPSGSLVLWREKSFEVMLDGEWVSGVFDRVVLNLDAETNPISATIYDFKTDQATNSEIEARYALQMESYRQALCAITKLSPGAIETRLIGIR